MPFCTCLEPLPCWDWATGLVAAPWSGADVPATLWPRLLGGTGAWSEGDVSGVVGGDAEAGDFDGTDLEGSSGLDCAEGTAAWSEEDVSGVEGGDRGFDRTGLEGSAGFDCVGRVVAAFSPAGCISASVSGASLTKDDSVFDESVGIASSQIGSATVEGFGDSSDFVKGIGEGGVSDADCAGMVFISAEDNGTGDGGTGATKDDSVFDESVGVASSQIGSATVESFGDSSDFDKGTGKGGVPDADCAGTVSISAEGNGAGDGGTGATTVWSVIPEAWATGVSSTGLVSEMAGVSSVAVDTGTSCDGSSGGAEAASFCWTASCVWGILESFGCSTGRGDSFCSAGLISVFLGEASIGFVPTAPGLAAGEGGSCCWTDDGSICSAGLLTGAARASCVGVDCWGLGGTTIAAWVSCAEDGCSWNVETAGTSCVDVCWGVGGATGLSSWTAGSGVDMDTGAEGLSGVGDTSGIEGITGTSGIGDGSEVDRITGDTEVSGVGVGWDVDWASGPSCVGGTSETEGVTGTPGIGDCLGVDKVTGITGLCCGGLKEDREVRLSCVGGSCGIEGVTGTSGIEDGWGVDGATGLSCAGIVCWETSTASDDFISDGTRASGTSCAGAVCWGEYETFSCSGTFVSCTGPSSLRTAERSSCCVCILDSDTCVTCVAGEDTCSSDTISVGLDSTGGVSNGSTSTLSVLLSAVGTTIGGDVGGVASITDGVGGTGRSPEEGDVVGPPRGTDGTEGSVASGSNGSLSSVDWTAGSVELVIADASPASVGGSVVDSGSESAGSGSVGSGSVGSEVGFVVITSAEREK